MEEPPPPLPKAGCCIWLPGSDRPGARASVPRSRGFGVRGAGALCFTDMLRIPPALLENSSLPRFPSVIASVPCTPLLAIAMKALHGRLFFKTLLFWPDCLTPFVDAIVLMAVAAINLAPLHIQCKHHSSTPIWFDALCGAYGIQHLILIRMISNSVRASRYVTAFLRVYSRVRSWIARVSLVLHIACSVLTKLKRSHAGCNQSSRYACTRFTQIHHR
jgi:hypothetical protein